MSQEIIAFEDQQFLDLTQRTRQRIINELLSKGTVPEDESSRNLLIKAMDGGDRQVLAKSKIRADDSANRNSASMQQQIVEMYRAIRTNAALPAAPGERELPPVPINMVPGHTDIGRKDINLSEIMREDD